MDTTNYNSRNGCFSKQRPDSPSFSTKLFGIALILIFFTTGCQTRDWLKEGKIFHEASLCGMIYNNQGQVCEKITVTTNGKKTISDINGRFTFHKMKRGNHQLIFTGKGFETLQLNVPFFDRMDVLHIRLISGNDYLGEVENKCGKGDFNGAEISLIYAERILGETDIILFWKGCLFYQKGKISQAIETCQRIRHRGSDLDTILDQWTEQEKD